MKFRSFKQDTDASAVPLILFVLTIIVCGALYTLFFIEIGIPILNTVTIPSSDSKTMIMTLIYAIPLIVLIVGLIALFISALKKENPYYSGGWYR